MAQSMTMTQVWEAASRLQALTVREVTAQDLDDIVTMLTSLGARTQSQEAQLAMAADRIARLQAMLHEHEAYQAGYEVGFDEGYGEGAQASRDWEAGFLRGWQSGKEAAVALPQRAN